jgi:DNA-binding transcriptional regulator YhcF (GntR family)
MARPVSGKVSDVLERLRLRLRDRFHRPGDRFLSNRAIAERFAVSYQTADRIVRTLVADGLLVRRGGAGTFVPGVEAPARVHLLFNERARRLDSFGQRLLAMLSARLTRESVAYSVSYLSADASVLPDGDAGAFPVLWECPRLLTTLTRRNPPTPLLLIADSPEPGLASVHTDSITIDDFSGAALAAQLLASARPRRFCVLAGPRNDKRSALRLAGFLSVCPDADSAHVYHARTWFLEAGLATAPLLLRTRPDAVFAANDRLAEAIILTARKLGVPCPRLVGFDDAPIAEHLGLTTIAIPWSDLVAATVAAIKRRLTGDTSVAQRITLIPRPIQRQSTG